MSLPLTMSVDVQCSPEHAFAAWTSGISAWWPRDHTVTGRPDLRVVLEAGTGGRIFERTADGVEHDWGVVTTWDPPTRLSYRWHLGQQPEAATEVHIRFLPRGPGSTRVEIEHLGWDRLGLAQDALRDRNRAGWSTLLPHFAAAIRDGPARPTGTTTGTAKGTAKGTATGTATGPETLN